MKVDYNRLAELIQKQLDCSAVIDIDEDDLVIGQNLSVSPEIKITFEGFGDLETEDENGEYVYEEGGNKDMRSFAIFVHKDSGKEGFVFPEHDVAAFTFGSMIYHRPKEEMCIYAWYDVNEQDWYIVTEGINPGKGDLSAYKVLKALEAIDKRGIKEMSVTIHKSEWHSMEKRYVCQITQDIVDEVYPDNSKKENREILKGMKDGTTDIDQFMDDAFGTADMDWDHEYDDLWTDRKGGYDITYEVE